MASEPLTRRGSELLDLVRGLSAIVVLYGHTRAGFFVDYAQIASPNPANKAAYFFAFAHEAVMIFFVLSGYFIGGSVLRTWERFSWRSYLVARLTRLYAVLVPAQLLTLFWDSSGIALFGADAGPYGNHWAGAHVADTVTAVSGRLTFPLFLGTLGFVNRVLLPDFGSNGVLWSLVCEFWFYLAFPCTLAVFAAKRPLVRVAGALATAAILWFVGGEFASYYPIWLFGAGVAVLQRRGIRPALPKVGAVAVASAALAAQLAVGRAHLLPALLSSDLVLGLLVAVWVFLVLGLPERVNPGVPTRFGRFSKELAGFSYTLYAVHAPLGTFVGVWLVDGQRWQPDLAHAALALGFMATAIAYAWLLSRLTEARTDRLRAFVDARLPRFAPAS